MYVSESLLLNVNVLISLPDPKDFRWTIFSLPSFIFINKEFSTILNELLLGRIKSSVNITLSPDIVICGVLILILSPSVYKEISETDVLSKLSVTEILTSYCWLDLRLFIILELLSNDIQEDAPFSLYWII